MLKKGQSSLHVGFIVDGFSKMLLMFSNIQECPKKFKMAITLFIFYKNLVYKNIKVWNCSKIKNIVVISLVVISISFEGFGHKITFL